MKQTFKKSKDLFIEKLSLFSNLLEVVILKVGDCASMTQMFVVSIQPTLNFRLYIVLHDLIISAY